ncbi:hypothetical protein GCM10010504_62640 [Streptomyces griseus]|nr:hypothetical protein GCM10010504_62640 [Streptomyces griseus]
MASSAALRSRTPAVVVPDIYVPPDESLALGGPTVTWGASLGPGIDGRVSRQRTRVRCGHTWCTSYRGPPLSVAYAIPGAVGGLPAEGPGALRGRGPGGSGGA